MAFKPEAEAMQELASMLWSRFLKERVREELNHELNAYKAEVVTNNGNGTLTVRRPFESVTPTLKAAPSLAYAQPGDMVMVAGIGDKSKALSNAFVLAKADLSDDTSVPVYGQGENLLRNWYFVGGGTGKGVFPVNRRRLTTYSGANQYTIDGWRATNVNTTVTLNASGMVTSAASGSSAYVVQYLNNQDSLLGKTVTLSILTSTGLRHATVKLPSTRPSAITTYATITNIGQIIWLSGFWCVRFTSATNGGNTYIAAKLELGTKQTLAHRENGVWVLNELPDYEDELVKCQTASVDNTDAYSQKSLATEQQIAYVENGLTASRAYAKGEYFCWNGLLYRAKSAIASGAAFNASANGNCESATVGDVMYEHRYPLWQWFSLAPGKKLTITIGGGNYAGQADVLIMPHSNGGAISGGMLHLTSYDTRANYHAIVPVYGSVPSGLTLASGAGYVSITNTDTTFTCVLNVVVLGDVRDVLSFAVS